MGAGGALDGLVVVSGHPDHFHIAVPLDQGTHPGPDDQVVVGQEHADRPGRRGLRKLLHDHSLGPAGPDRQ
jgi:hypothetical protein